MVQVFFCDFCGISKNTFFVEHLWITASVLSKLRNNSLKNYGLFLSHYLSSPDLSWDAMLNMTKGILDNVFQMVTCICSLENL